MEFNFNALGGKTVLEAEKSSFVDPKLLVVKPENGKNNTYSLSCRFLPNLASSATASIYEKNYVRLSTGQNGETVVMDMPKRSGYMSIFRTADSVLRSMEYNKEEEDVVREIRKNFSAYTYFYAYAYIEKDLFHPENEKTVKILRFPYKIKKFFLDEEAEGVDVMSLTQGKRFTFKVSKQGVFPTYDGCHFADEISQFQYYDADGTLRIATDAEVNAIIQGQVTPLRTFLEQNTEGLERYLYQEPTKEQLVKAANLFRQIFFKFPSIYNRIMSESSDVEMKEIIGNCAMGQQAQPAAQQPVASQTAYVPTSAQSQPAAQPAPSFNQAQTQPVIGADDPLGFNEDSEGTNYAEAWNNLMK